MSINHFSSDFQGTLLWPQQQHSIMENHLSSDKPNPTWISHHHHHHPNSTCFTPLPPTPLPTSSSSMPFHSPSFTFNLNHDTTPADDDEDAFNQTTADDGPHYPNTHHDDASKVDGKEPMFEKPLTPSDVGKLNRLVIPKQYAEKYFPLSGSGDSGDKGLLLSFEDESGKFWRFRYSYWNSSQSYVLTKGWSRYVKEKRLDAGDVVVFERHRLDSDRLFIGWKRRSPAAVQDSSSPGVVARHSGSSTSGGGWTRMFYSAHPYPSQKHHLLRSVPCQSDCPHAESPVQSQTVSVGNSKILRLFGVNLECQTDESEPEPEPPSTPGAGSFLSGHHHFYPHYSSPIPDHMDFTFSQDVKQTRNHRG